MLMEKWNTLLKPSEINVVAETNWNTLSIGKDILKKKIPGNQSNMSNMHKSSLMSSITLILDVLHQLIMFEESQRPNTITCQEGQNPKRSLKRNIPEFMMKKLIYMEKAMSHLNLYPALM